MKKLSLTFGIIGILLLSLGLYNLFIYNQTIFIFSFIGGLISTSLYLITQNMLNADVQK